MFPSPFRFPSRAVQWSALGVVVTIMTVNYIGIQALKADWTSVVEEGDPRQDLLKLVNQISKDDGDYLWRDADDDSLPVMVVGTQARPVSLDNDMIMDARTGNPYPANEGKTFNLAVAKMPRGSAWQFIGVARGPTRTREFAQIAGLPAREQSLIAFGLNMTADGELIRASIGTTIDLPMLPEEDCHVSGQYIATYGPEDPRIFWTDAGTIGLTYSRTSEELNRCRGIAYVDDLRSGCPMLHEAMAISDGATPYRGTREIGAGLDRELVKGGQKMIEKNVCVLASAMFRTNNQWAAFFPGASAQAARPAGLGTLSEQYGLSSPAISEPSIPYIHYKLSPASVLAPVSRDPRHVYYETVQSWDTTCVWDAHSGGSLFAVHQATPFYRLTLCPRGTCIPTDRNTVLLAVAHGLDRPRYAKFASLHSVSMPHDPISVGPLFEISGQRDRGGEINYVMTLVPLTASDGPQDVVDNTIFPQQSTQQDLPPGVLPGHFFLDDNVLVTMGHNDEYMTQTVMPLIDMIGRQRICPDQPEADMIPP